MKIWKRVINLIVLLISGTVMAQSNFFLTSNSFHNNKEIPNQYTKYYDNISPQLTWHNAPKGTKNFALIVDDPDAPGGKEPFVHWVVYNIPANATLIDEGIKHGQDVFGGVQGLNDFNDRGYDGPKPPDEKSHRYFFTLYALDTKINTTVPLTKKELLVQIRGHILGEAKLMGTFKKP